MAKPCWCVAYDPPRPLRYDQPEQFALDLMDMLANADDCRIAWGGNREYRDFDAAVTALDRRLEAINLPELRTMLEAVCELGVAMSNANHDYGVRYGVIAERFRAGTTSLVADSR